MYAHAPTYPRLVLEFLSSIDVKFPSEDDYAGVITFRMMNKEVRWTFSNFNDCIGLPTGGSHGFDSDIKWNEF